MRTTRAGTPAKSTGSGLVTFANPDLAGGLRSVTALDAATALEQPGDEVPLDGTPTQHARQAYLPKPERRHGIALCLSGGGYRAALFHLGALRRLNELGVLSRVTTISSVSGGSIVAAHLAHRIKQWPAPARRVDDWDRLVATPFKELTTRDLRTGPVLKRLWPWNWLRASTAVDALQGLYERHLTDLRLIDLPSHPRFVFCATDLSYAIDWQFQRDRVGDAQAGYAVPPPRAWTVARAVAASSCCPPIFGPQRVGLPANALKGGKAKGRDRDKIGARLELSDGGLYDNLGLEPVWKDHETILVSDGGSPFGPSSDSGLIWRVLEYVNVLSEQVGALRKRWLVSDYIAGVMQGAYWGIGSDASHYAAGVRGYSKDLVDDVVSQVRTDLDPFSKAEQAVLENHGYALAEAAIRRHAPALIAPDAAEYHVPNPEWMDESKVSKALSNSNKRHLLPGL